MKASGIGLTVVLLASCAAPPKALLNGEEAVQWAIANKETEEQNSKNKATIRPQLSIFAALSDAFDADVDEKEKIRYLNILFDAVRECAKKDGAWTGEAGESASNYLETIFEHVGDRDLHDRLGAPELLDVRQILAWLAVLHSRDFPRCARLIKETPPKRFPAFYDYDAPFSR